MSTASQIERLTTARNTIRTKLVALGLANSTDLLDDLATVISNIADNGAVSQVLDATTGKQSYTVPAGYHNGSGAVSIVLEEKNATPTKSAQDITPTAGKVLSKVTVAKIPDAYQDVSGVTAVAGDVLKGKKFVDSTGAEITGTIESLAATTYNVSATDQTIAAGQYLSGAQTIRAVVLSNLSAANIKKGVTVKVGDAGDDDRIAAVAGTFTDASTVSSGQEAASAAEIRSGYSAWVDGAEVQGTLDDTQVVEGTTTVSGTTATRGEAEWNAGVISAGSIGAAVFANVASENVEYVDISGTTDAPVLVSGSYLFINKGYVDNLKISLAKLVPDGASADLASDKILSGYSAYNNDGQLVAGSIQSKAAQTYYPSASDQSIAAGQYLSGAQTIKAVIATNLSAANIKYGVTVKIGDADDDDRVASATGTFSGANTVSSGQTAAGGGQILEDYSAFVDGAEVQGTMANNGAVAETIDGLTETSYTIPAGYHNGSGTVSLDDTIENALAAI